MAKHIVKEIPFWDGSQLHQPGAIVEYEGKPSKNLEPVKGNKKPEKEGESATGRDLT